MATKCFSVVRGKRVRVTKLDECGNPVDDPCGFVVTQGFVSVAFTAEIEDEEEIQVKNANGDICVLDTTCPSLKYYSLEVEFCDVDPELLSLMSGYDTVDDWNGDAVGFQVGEDISCGEGFALELWSGVPGVECDATQSGATYGYFLVPWVTNAILGDFTIENDATTFSVSGRSKKGHGWGVGPYDVVTHESTTTPGTAGDPGPLLTALPSSKHLHMQLTTVAPPAAVCGCQALVVPPAALVGQNFREQEAGTASIAAPSGSARPSAMQEPAKSDPKDEWVAFAESKGMSRDEARKSSKDDLIGKFASS